MAWQMAAAKAAEVVLKAREKEKEMQQKAKEISIDSNQQAGKMLYTGISDAIKLAMAAKNKQAAGAGYMAQLG